MSNTRSYIEAFMLTAVFFAIVTILAVIQYQIESPNKSIAEPIFIAIGIIPILLYFISTGRLKQFRGGGFEIALRQQADRVLSDIRAENIVEVEEVIQQDQWIDHLRNLIETRRPTTLAFDSAQYPWTLEDPERENYYTYSIIDRFLEELDEELEYIIFIRNGRFEGYMHVDDFETLFDDIGSQLSTEIENGEILSRPSVGTAAIRNDSTNRELLREMDRLNVNEIALVDPSDRFFSVVTQEEIVRKLLSNAIQQI